MLEDAVSEEKKITEYDLEPEKDYIAEEYCTQSFDNFTAMADDEIAIKASTGDVAATEFLLVKYKNFVRSKARSYFLIGADKEDIVQEGMIGLYKAIRDYKMDKKASFRAFAELCITRQIITAIKTATRQKHKPLNSYISLNKPIYEDECERTLVDIIGGEKMLNPEDIIIDQEDLSSIELKIGEMLSELERKVLSLYLQGRSYVEIGKTLNRHVKSIDNALQRIKGKLEKYLTIKTD